MRLLTVVGNRPQFIKAAPVSAALRDVGVEELLLHTGQHYDANMSDVFFDELGIPAPWRSLGVGSGSHAAQTAAMLTGIETAILDARPDRVLVYGDTNSTLAAAMAAAKLCVPIGHVEAGLRSFDRAMPEEINRIVTDHLADLLLAPTTTAVENLQHEGRPAASVHLVGDVMYDVALSSRAEAAHRKPVPDADPDRLLLATIHRAENTDDPTKLAVIVDALVELSDDFDVVVPLHPRTSDALRRAGLAHRLAGSTFVTEPLGFFDMVALEQQAKVIVTDSGGVQREAFFHQVPCVVVRPTTEWVELVEHGWTRLAGPTDAAAITEAVRVAVVSPGRPADLFGGGRAAAAVAALIAGSDATSPADVPSPRKA